MIKNTIQLDHMAASTPLTDDAVLLDCETVSMRRQNAPIAGLYLIRKENGTLLAHCYVTEKKEDEYDLLLMLIKHLQDVQRVITFNGTSFDLPRLRQRLASFGLADPFLGKNHLDLYTALRPLDRFFNLPDRKLRTYYDFMNGDGSRTVPEVECLLHILPLLSLAELFDGHYEIERVARKESPTDPGTEELLFTLRLPTPVPLCIRKDDTCFTLTADGAQATLRAQVFDGMLRRYYTDVAQYMYLPAEGYAVHKDVATIVGNERKEKAVRANCFTLFPIGDSFLDDADTQRSYIDSVLSYLLS